MLKKDLQKQHLNAEKYMVTTRLCRSIRVVSGTPPKVCLMSAGVSLAAQSGTDFDLVLESQAGRRCLLEGFLGLPGVPLAPKYSQDKIDSWQI